MIQAPAIASFESLIFPIEQTLTTPDRALIEHAYYVASEAHQGQKRKSGEAYFVHCVAVARILIEMQLDTAVIAAGLLHDVVEDTSLTLVDIEEEFNEEIARLVEGVTKMEAIPLGKDKERNLEAREAEFLRKTLLAMDSDVRVILIKLADRLHNMRTLGYLKREKQLRMAHETMNIFAPLASRLGIWQMKWELEDLSLRYINPEQYRHIANLIDNRRTQRDSYIDKVVEQMRSLLAEHNIDAQVSGRPKHIYSIWRKMERKSLSFDKIYDVRAVRVIVEDRLTCYQVLGLVHATWRPIPEEFDDYIAAPKDNFYQSLHTAVILGDGNTLEVQIRTHEMHVHAEYGVAAHWRYKENSTQNQTEADDVYNRRIRKLRDMMEVGKTADTADEFLDAMRTDVFEDRVYAFTPKGDIIDLPAGSTPIDFAYHIHTDVGNRCRGAKVNGKLVPLHYQLEVGDRVDILTAGRGGPSRDWLNPNLKYVKTKRAAAKIRQWFRKQDRDKMILVGKEHLNQELKRLGINNSSHDDLANMLGVSRTDDMFAQIGFGDLHPQHVASKIIELDRQSRPEEAEIPVEQQVSTLPVRAPSAPPEDIAVQGIEGLLTNLARCCNPVLGEEIVGYVTVGRGVSIHRKDCSNVLNLPKNRLIEVSWGKNKQTRYPVPVKISAYDREGLMRDIGTAVADEGINIREISVSVRNNIAYFNVTLEVSDMNHLSRVLSRLEQLPNIIEAQRSGE